MDQAEFIAVLEQFGILSRVTGAYAPWQNSLAERHGAILGTAWMTLIHDYKVDSRPMMKMTLTCAFAGQETRQSLEEVTQQKHWCLAETPIFLTF